MIKVFNRFREYLTDHSVKLKDRTFMLFSTVTVVALLVTVICGLFMHDHIYVTAGTFVGAVLLGLYVFYSFRRKKIEQAKIVISVVLVFLFIPALFFTSGGVSGGAPIWLLLGCLYMVLVLDGKPQLIMCTLNVIVLLLCWAIGYYYPQFVIEYSREENFFDTLTALIIVSNIFYVMINFQTRLYHSENELAEEKSNMLEEMNRSQNRFFSSMSHEIRTPINSILGLNELTLRDQDATDEIVRNSTGIQGAGKLLLALINDILDFSKMEAGSMDIVPVDYHVGDMISEVVNMIWLKANDKGLKFDVSIDPKVPSVLYGDEVRIKQVIINLLNNAVKYTQEGTVGLYIDSDETDERSTVLSISISDTGMGIKKESLPYLFDAFKRVDEEKNRMIEGTGLGLSIVKQFVELMGGNVTVNSVYGEGSTFTVTLKQGVSDVTEIGELNIHSQQMAKRSRYESSFKAPDARILIVDDNEMNLEVEKKLLTDTEIAIDTVLSGREALEMTVRSHYDVILMDHLMPEMDGIECLEAIRNQSGGMNRNTPVVVLTANAGSENRDLYNRSGFDGYLVKPVSGEMMEEMLIRHISRDKLMITGQVMHMREDISATKGYSRKASVIITSSSMCDLPDSVIKKLNIPIIPFLIRTDKGVFKDGVQMDSNELIRYINDGRNAVSLPPDVKAYTDFFAGHLKKAHHIIHISITSSMSDDFKIASEAARSFDNVTVVNSESLSSSTGILVLIAHKLAQQNIPVSDIVAEIENVKKRLMCSFVIDTTEYMAKRGLVSHRINKISTVLNLHPCIHFKDDRSMIGGVWMGNTKRAYRKYIHNAFPIDIIPDSDILFITYVDVPVDTLMWVKEEISKNVFFKHVVFKQASAAISSNCGPGALGFLYFVKSNKVYNIGSYFAEYDERQPEVRDSLEETANAEQDVTAEETGSYTDENETAEMPWYKKIDFIDGDTAIKNSGSEDALQAVLKMFLDSYPDRSGELSGFYSAENWKDYTIKAHALKSSARLIGATELSKKAEALENAGKEEDFQYIRDNHGSFMDEYGELVSKLSYALFDGAGEPAEETEKTEEDKPLADEYLMEGVFEGLHEAAEAPDPDTINEIFNELDNYSLSERDKEKIGSIREKAEENDYKAILAILEQD